MAQAPINRPMVVECLEIIISGLEATSLGELSDKVARGMATSLARLLRALGDDLYSYSHDTDDATFRTIREIRNTVRMIKVNPAPDDNDRWWAKEHASALKRYLFDLTAKPEAAGGSGTGEVVPCPWCGASCKSPQRCPDCGRLPDWRARIDSDHAHAEALLPPGWEGLTTFEPLETIANIEGYLRRELAGLRLLGERGRGSFWLERANELYANVYRQLDRLRIFDRPEQQSEANKCDEAERRLSELWRWCAAQGGDTRPAEIEADAGNGGPTEPAGEAGPDSPTGFLGGAALAIALGVDATRRNAFDRQLGRQRMSLGDDCWHEVRDPRPNDPRFLYRADSPKLRDLAAAYQTPKPA